MPRYNDWMVLAGATSIWFGFGIAMDTSKANLMGLNGTH